MDYYSLESEQVVIVSLLLDNTKWPVVQVRLSMKDFYRREHQVLFDLISKKLEQGEFVDVLSLSNEVKTIRELKEINGELYVFEIFKQTYSAANIATYVDIVRVNAHKRHFKEIHMGGIEQHDEQDGLSNEVYLSTTKKESTNV